MNGKLWHLAILALLFVNGAYAQASNITNSTNSTAPLSILHFSSPSTSVYVNSNMTMTVYVSGGVAPYTYTFQIYNSTGLAYQYTVQNASQIQSYTFKLTNITGIGLYSANVQVTDSETAPQSLGSRVYIFQVYQSPGLFISGTDAADTGQTITLGATLSNLGPGINTYQWYNGTNPISGATSLSYTTTAGATGTFDYYIVVFNSEGAQWSANHNVTVTGQPGLNITGINITDVGQMVTLNAKITSQGAGGTTIRWYNDTSGTGVYTSQSGSTFTASLPVGQYKYYAVLNDSNGGTGRSNIFAVTVSPLPTIKVTVSGTTVGTGETVQFANSTSGGVAPYTYTFTVNPGIDGVDYIINGSAMTFYTPGSYNITESVTDNLGNTATALINITVATITIPTTSITQQAHNSTQQPAPIYVNSTSTNFLGNYVIAQGAPLLLNLSSLNSMIEVSSNSSAASNVSVHVSKYVGSVPQNPGFSLIQALNMTANNGKGLRFTGTEPYPCSINVSTLALYTIRNNTLSPVTNSSLDASACTVTFTVPADPVVLLYAASLRSSPQNTATTSIQPTRNPLGITLNRLTLYVFVVLAVLLILVYIYRRRARRVTSI